jgi:pimeloyl-ACP methyl ester carboxylesterase
MAKSQQESTYRPIGMKPLRDGTVFNGLNSELTVVIEKVWETLLKEYAMSNEQALAYRQNPIDILEPIARAKIPLLHIVSLNDRVVPPEESTFILAERYRKLGGTIEVIEVKEGTAKSNGHHFTHPDPKRVADFIEAHASQEPS